MQELFEIFMIVSFGLSWPISVRKSYKARTAKGKSLSFLLLIIFGYLCGITSKLIADSFKWYVLLFYVINLVVVSIDLCMYFRNRKLDKIREQDKAIK